MAIHSSTEIYGTVEDLQDFVGRAVVDLRRDVKTAYAPALIYGVHSLGALILRANKARDAGKAPIIDLLLEELEVLQSMLRMLKKRGWLPYRAYEESVPITVSISKQATKWKNHYLLESSPAA